MKSRKLPFLTLTSFLFFTTLCYSQVLTPRPTSISGTCGGYYEYLPQGYSTSTSQTYPLIVAVHGIGEIGNGTTDLGNLLNCWTAIPRLIANGGFPNSFNVGGQSFSFIVIAPQFNQWPYASDVNAVVDYAVSHYKVDQSRIYVTGLSMGGGAAWDFAGNYPTKAAAVVPVCGAASSDPTRAQAIANAQLPIWATHNQYDPTVPVTNTTGWVSLIGQYGWNIQSTIFPVSGHDAWSQTYNPSFTQNGVNVYQWMLMHQKGSTSTPPPPPPTVANQPPTANAGPDQTITLPTNSVTLSGSGTDPDGTVSFYQWSQASGPSQASFSSLYSANPVVTGLVQGTYVFTLKVTDNLGATGTSNVTITVNASTNQPPTANAGPNQTITLPQSSVTLAGSGTDPDGTISFYQWSQASGPSPASFSNLYTATPIVTGLVQGSYVFTLKVTDNQGATATSNVTITVNAAANQPPVANAGANQTITLPQSSVTLSGSGTDADGTISTYQWTEASGPSQATIASASAASTQVSNLVQGSYVFTLKVTDNQGATATSNVTITVNAAANQPPVANAGANQTITLPQSSTILVGSGSDPDGTISGYQWSQVSGPSQLTFGNAGSAMCTISNFQKGVYVLRLTVKDNQGATAWNEMTLTVLPPPNQPPVADAGADQTITLPVNSVNLLGTASDPDGTVVSYSWTQTSGPTKTSFSSASPLALTVNNLEEGIYVFRLTVTDNDGATTWDEVKVTVLPDPRTVSTATVFPNPATNLINLKIDALTAQNNSVLRITNSAGTVVYTESFQRTGFTMIKQVDITKLPSGIYFLSVTSDINTVTTIKFVKQ